MNRGDSSDRNLLMFSDEALDDVFTIATAMIVAMRMESIVDCISEDSSVLV